jgi:Lrp/AsnC family leucine-responsive transcriptional regulator
VFSRVRRLRESGAISGFGARVDPAVFGYGVLAFVRVELNRATDAQALIDRFASSPDCEACYALGHAEELLLRIRLRSLEELSPYLGAIRRGGGRPRAELVVRTVFERDFTPRLA